MTRSKRRICAASSDSTLLLNQKQGRVFSSSIRLIQPFCALLRAPIPMGMGLSKISSISSRISSELCECNTLMAERNAHRRWLALTGSPSLSVQAISYRVVFNVLASKRLSCVLPVPGGP
ncbi:hypothetical protein D3C75_840110 [compost metagenome]